MTDPLWWIVGIYLLIATALLVGNQRPRACESAVLRFQNSVGVDLPASLGEELRKRLQADRRSQLLGGMAGILVSSLIVRPLASDPGTLEVVILAAGAFAGSALAISLTTLFRPRRAADDHVRYARSHAVALSDYVPGAERWLARGPAVLAALYFIVWAVGILDERLPQSGLPVLLNGAVLVVLSVGSLAIFEIAGRRIVAMGNRVGTPEELVWEDAIRSHAVRDIAIAPALVGLYAILYSLPTLFDLGSGYLQWSGMAITAAVLLVLLVTVLLKPERHFLRRLWPELAATTGKPYGAEPEA